MAEEIQEMRHAWLENHFTLDQILGLIETCDKHCKSCKFEQHDDCHVEMRESIHSLAAIVKDLCAQLLLGNVVPKEERVEKKVESPYG